MKNFVSAEFKLVSEMKKNELAFEFVENSENIAKLKESLKILEKRNEEIESLLVGQISPKYQPTGAKFILLPKVSKGRAVPSYKTVCEVVPEKFKFNETQKAVLKELISENTPTPKDTKKIEIVK